MMVSRGLSFLERIGAVADAKLAARIDQALQAQHAVGAAAWPAVNVTQEDWATVFANRLRGVATDVEAAILALPAANLYIACACAHADPDALRQFEHRYFANLRGVVSHIVSCAAELDEVTQILREKLFCPRPQEPPRILEIAGQGDLAAVIRVAAVRIALNLKRSEQRSGRVADRATDHLLGAMDDPEVATLREQQRGLFKQAIEEAIAALSIRDRNVLRMHLLDGLSIDDIGRAHQVHRATAARWLEQIRSDLRTGTMRRLRDLLRGSSAELDSLARVLDSRLRVSFSRILDKSTQPTVDYTHPAIRLPAPRQSTPSAS